MSSKFFFSLLLTFKCGKKFMINVIFTLQGCFLDSKECYDKPRCVEKNADRKKLLFFCCCDGNMCNQNFTWDPQPTERPQTERKNFF